MKKQTIGMLCATALLSSCHIYKSYDRPKDIEASGLYRDTVSVADTLVSDTVNFGNLPWREVFTDPQLQALIEQGLTHNTDLLTAALKVKEAQASLMSARLAYAPSLDCHHKEPSAALISMPQPKPIRCRQQPAGRSIYSASC